MSQPRRLSLQKKDRLKSRKRIDALFSGGRKLQQFPVRLLYAIMPDESAGVRAGFTASSRTYPRAVDRNRLKRVLREGYRLQQAAVQEAAARTGIRVELFFIFTGREMSDQALLFRTIGLLLQKLLREMQ